jgi:hypothetical protein
MLDAHFGSFGEGMLGGDGPFVDQRHGEDVPADVQASLFLEFLHDPLEDAHSGLFERL